MQGRAGQRQHAVEFGQEEHGFGGHRVGDRVAVGGEHAAFERRAVLARSPHQPYAAKMARERELKIIRRAYAKQVTAAAGEPGDHLEAVEPAGPPGAAAGHDRPRHGAFGALFRAAQMAGAMEAALTLSTRYANDRVQFGRPIARFQAIQQQLALLAKQAVAASVAVESAAIAVAVDRPSAALAPRRRQNPRRGGRRQGRRDRTSGARRDRLHARAQPAPPDAEALVVARRVRHRKPLAARARPPDDGSARMPSGRRSPAADSVVRY